MESNHILRLHILILYQQLLHHLCCIFRIFSMDFDISSVAGLLGNIIYFSYACYTVQNSNNQCHKITRTGH